MNWLLIVVVFFLAGCIVWGFSKGALHVIYTLLAWAAMLIFVTFATPYVEEYMTEHTRLDERIEDNCRKMLRETIGDKINKKQKEQNLLELGLNLPPDVIKGLEKPQKKMEDALEKNGFYDVLAVRAAKLAMHAISFAVVLIVTFFAFHLLAKILDLVNYIPVIGGINHLLGAVAGFGKGILIIWIIFAIAALLGTTAAGTAFTSAIMQSPLLVWLYENNLILAVLLYR